MYVVTIKIKIKLRTIHRIASSYIARIATVYVRVVRTAFARVARIVCAPVARMTSVRVERIDCSLIMMNPYVNASRTGFAYKTDI